MIVDPSPMIGFVVLGINVEVTPSVAIGQDPPLDPEKRKELADALAEYNLTMDLIGAEAYKWSSRQIEEIESMLASLQARRDAIIREIGAYRDRSRIVDGASSDRRGRLLKASRNR